MEHTIRLTQVYPYTREQVWHALTDSGALGSWLMPNDFEPEPNREFTFHMKPQRGWDGITYCQIIELQPFARLAYSYRSSATGEKTLACAGIDSDRAKDAAKGIFTQLDTVLRFTLTNEPSPDGKSQTRLVLEHSGFKGFKLMLVSVVMGWGWRKMLRRLSTTLEQLAPLAGTSAEVASVS